LREEGVLYIKVEIDATDAFEMVLPAGGRGCVVELVFSEAYTQARFT
jgi:hypothetical protein